MSERRKIARIEVSDREKNIREHRYARSAREFLKVPLMGADELQLFLIKSREGIDVKSLSEWTSKIFCDPILQTAAFDWDESKPIETSVLPSYVCEILYLPGVTDNVGRSATEALYLLQPECRTNDVQVYSGSLVYLYGEISRAEAERVSQELLGNPLIQSMQVLSWGEHHHSGRFLPMQVPEVSLSADGEVELISLDLPDDHLESLSKERCWALTIQEIKVIRDFFAQEKIRSRRINLGLPEQQLTDVEIEVLAQTWSEHCKHKIFAAKISYTEQLSGSYLPKVGDHTVGGVFKTYIRGVTERIRQERKLDWLVSVFTDNAGIVRFDKQVDLCIKVETHNSPSALDPYGGALTGIVGVNRDILGCGMGARPIANTDVFCFASPDWPTPGEEKELPPPLKHPRRIFSGVHRGVEDGGNKSGIPTINGAIVFHRDYAGKPLVYCGTIGVLPPQLPSGASSSGKGQKPGDFIVMAGGRIGKDGIHGATFSSMELTEGAPATVVQIGDPITQKRLADFLLEARDQELFTSVTDNGAGGLSSSVGEMGSLCNGAELDVGNAPVKYTGLKPYELVVSESQERMSFAVAPQKLEAFLALAKRRGVEATPMGNFTGDGEFRIKYNGKVVGMIPMDFLHDGLPQMELKAHFPESVVPAQAWAKEVAITQVKSHELGSRSFLEKALFTLLSRWNVRSKESWVRQYDHEVQAATILKPFTGVKAEGPSDAGVLWMAPHGGESYNAVAIACGIAPRISRHDTYLMAQHAVDEAVRNCVASGADPDMLALVDNFCWPDPLPGVRNPDAEYKLAQLVRAGKGLYDLALAYGAPFVSGKDSMKNDFLGRTRFGKDVKISIPPTLLVTAIAKVPDARKIVSTDFKEEGHSVFILGSNSRFMTGSELLDAFQLPKDLYLDRVPEVDGAKQILLYRRLHQAMKSGLVQSCHDCSEGGLLVAVAESCIGGELGLELDLSQILWQEKGAIWELFFNEAPGRFVVSVSAREEASFLKLFAKDDVLRFGRTTKQDVLRILREGLVLVDAPIAKLKRAWQGETV